MEDGYIEKTLEILKLAGFDIDEDSGNITRSDHLLSMAIGEYLEDTYETFCYYNYNFDSHVTQEAALASGIVRLPDTSNIKNLAIAIRDYFNEDKERCDKLANEAIALYRAVSVEYFEVFDNEDYKVEEIYADLPRFSDAIKKGVIYITTYAKALRENTITTASPYNYITKQIRWSGEASYEDYSDDIIRDYKLIDISNVDGVLNELHDFHASLYQLLLRLKLEAAGPPDREPPDQDPPGWD